MEHLKVTGIVWIVIAIIIASLKIFGGTLNESMEIVLSMLIILGLLAIVISKALDDLYYKLKKD